jgi:hypothetical protein
MPRTPGPAGPRGTPVRGDVNGRDGRYDIPPELRNLPKLVLLGPAYKPTASQRTSTHRMMRMPEGRPPW